MDTMKGDKSLDNYFGDTTVLGHQVPQMLTKKGQKKVRSRYATSGNKSQVTTVGCI